MFTTYRLAVLALIRRKETLIWAFIFPLVLASIFGMMFGSIDAMARDLTIKFVQVAATSAEQPSQGQAQEISASYYDSFFSELASQDSVAHFEVVKVFSEAEAIDYCAQNEKADNPSLGYVALGDEGMVDLHLSANAGSSNTSTSSLQGVLVAITSTYNSRYAQARELATSNPQAFAREQVQEALSSQAPAIEKVALTKAAPQETAQFYFALVAFACIQAAMIGLDAMCSIMADQTRKGARVAVSGMSKIKIAFCELFAAWTVCFAAVCLALIECLAISGISLGAQLPLLILIVAVASLASTMLGAAIGGIGRMPVPAKGGILTMITCLCAYFAGLYGQPVMQFANMVARNAPVVALVNPERQIMDAFTSVLYYDSPAPALAHVAVLAVFAALFFIFAALSLRKASYASL